MNTLQDEWDFTNRHIQWLKERFISLHEKNSKDWSDLEKWIASEYRSSAISTGEYRYWILVRARHDGIQLE